MLILKYILLFKLLVAYPVVHHMTPEEKIMYPGRENWDKIEWYESQFKSAKVVLIPKHEDEWDNVGLEKA